MFGIHALLGAAAFAQSAAGGAWFTDVTGTALPGVVTTCGGAAKAYIVEVNGPGLGLADLDADGDLDLVVVDGSTLERVRAGERGLPPRVFLNDGSGRFAAGGDAWALAPGRFGTGVAIADVDGDRDPDLVVLEWGANRLFLNEGGEGFAAPVALPAGPLGDCWSTSAAFLDADADGRLDLYVANYLVPDVSPEGAHGGEWKGHAVMRGPRGLTPVPDQWLRGTGGGGFEDASEASGIRAAEPGYGLGVITADFDRDGRTDVFVGNDSSPNFLWRNLGGGRFEEVGLRLGVSHDGHGRAQASMGIAAGDLDGDGWCDLFVTNFSNEANTYYEATGRGSFRDRSSRRNLVAGSLHRLGWGTGFQDADRDGDLDLWVLNGHVYPEADRAGTDTSYAQGDQLFVQGADGRFTESPLSGGAAYVSRAGVQGDLDRDGDLDLVVAVLDGPVRVLRNDAKPGEGSAWLGLRLSDPGSNTAGLGAAVEVEVDERRRSDEVRTSGGYQAAVPPEVHFTFAAVAERRATITVRWPDGARETWADAELDRWTTLARGTGAAPSESGGGKR